MAFLQRSPCTGLQGAQGFGARRCARTALPVLAAANGSTATSNGNGNSKVTDIYGNTAVLGPTMNAEAHHSMPERETVPASPEVQEILDAQGIDLEISGLKYLSNDGRVSTPTQAFEHILNGHGGVQVDIAFRGGLGGYVNVFFLTQRANASAA